MEIYQSAVAGTIESSDIMITIDPKEDKGIELSLTSSVEKQFGQQIRKVIMDTLQDLGIERVKVTATDKGALDCTIRARTVAAVYRAAKQERYDWKEIGSWNV
ncbi:citrate lyase acyl carrier protein [Enterococcus sp. DIV1298c]|uniref:Citrate lyase acyl carrier protein n=1 Tax=Candidatus Enterococcus mangumiae TaxID=2230878 RepID=A0ABZ2T542_9ENTE|nr:MULTISPECIES: citrate lyase acyl carrier protein [unclassified Enterococcus]MBO0460849.1 citrate lyase acyl carrier protein [Enterococcus sp. DIV1298c]MBO0491177.1 citrate lyase acyl carrier protein [Enterococcus sp. DIV1094]